jgi:hypothetical protein
MATLELDAAAGIVGLSFVQLFGMYRDTAPKLTDVRQAPAGDYSTRQMILDADILVGGLAVGIGVVMTLLTHNVYPAILMLAGFTMVSVYYHAVCNSASPTGG